MYNFAGKKSFVFFVRYAYECDVHMQQELNYSTIKFVQKYIQFTFSRQLVRHASFQFLFAE